MNGAFMMNFSPFTSPFQSTLPSMHQFTTKFADPLLANTTGMLTGPNTVMITTLAGDGSAGGIQYLPVSATSNSSMHSNAGPRITTLPVTQNIQVVNANSSNSKYSPGATIIGWENIPVHHFTTVDPKVVSMPYTTSPSNIIQASNQPTVWPVRLLNAELAAEFSHETEPQDLCKVEKEEREMKEEKLDDKAELIQLPLQTAWADGTVGDYLARLPASTIPLSLHHLLKFTESGKKEDLPLLSEHHITDHTEMTQPEHMQDSLQQTQVEHQGEITTQQGKKKKKKQKVKEKKPRYRPGEIRLSTALDGSTLFCCPECHMAYPERFSLEQHLAGHKMERRFVCDVCGAGLKRKEHLDQHKRGHSQERPFVCTICTKGFKRNEHLTRHYVVHSGDKSYMCGECGKAFSRKDHLHKHAQTHIAKRVKAELSQQSLPLTSSVPVPAPILS